MKDYEKVAKEYKIPEEEVANFIWLCRSLDTYREALKIANKYNNKEKIREYKGEIKKLSKEIKKYNVYINKKAMS